MSYADIVLCAGLLFHLLLLPMVPARGSLAMSDGQCHAMAGRLATYRVVVADDLTLGFMVLQVTAKSRFARALAAISDWCLRLDVSACQWITPTLGSEKSAACLRRFDDRPAAVRWLQEREPAPGIGRRRADA
jgi:hypothetical protein